MTWADQVENRLRSQDDYYHDVRLFHWMLRFQIAKALVDLRRKRVPRFVLFIRIICAQKDKNEINRFALRSQRAIPSGAIVQTDRQD